MTNVTVFWFRRDLRLTDNHGLFAAAAMGRPVMPLFIFDVDILDRLARDDARVEFIHRAVTALHEELKGLGGGLTVAIGRPTEILASLFKQHKISDVVVNEDYEPYAVARDLGVRKVCAANGVRFTAVKDQMIFAPTEVMKDDGTPYRVYGAYARRWRERWANQPPKFQPSKSRLAASGVTKAAGPPSLARIGFTPSGLQFPKERFPKSIVTTYGETRDLMGVRGGTSRLGVHLRFGTISVRKLAHASLALSSIYFGELIWREFFMQILAHFPRTLKEPFDQRFARVEWRKGTADFRRWCEGRTGYPVVDAGMRELNQTGFMHNRARMIVGSFLCKHLLIDWRRGEAYFAAKLLDFERSSNVGNWQWIAGCGCDAAPYFRIFNPALQQKRFDPEGRYAARWVPELKTGRYPEPIVPHEFARRRALATLTRAVKGVNA